MGYTTEFSGSVSVMPPLNPAEVDFLKRFAGSRRMDRAEGPYYAQPGTNYGQDRTSGIRDYNKPPAGQPGLWCQWVPTEDGTAIEWNGTEKFYDSVEWMRYLIDHFVGSGAEAQNRSLPTQGRGEDFSEFTFNHVVNGAIWAQGEDHSDTWALAVRNNQVTEVRGLQQLAALEREMDGSGLPEGEYTEVGSAPALTHQPE